MPLVRTSTFQYILYRTQRLRCFLVISSTRRTLSTAAESFSRHLSEAKNQIYISRSHDPFLNLSIEHHLLQESPADSTILFLYINRPCIVIGRNQNPWLETDLNKISKPVALHDWESNGKRSKQAPTIIDLVRRRSGGGTVFHDGGNLNYSVVRPSSAFRRDLSAELVTRAIRTINPRARVNVRHDIVLDQGPLLPPDLRPDPTHMYSTAYTSEEKTPLKISGSAFKLTKGRALHHGTCLVASPNMQEISALLRSPAGPHIKARGVDSVRSPVGNICESYEAGMVQRISASVVDEFCNDQALDRIFVREILNGSDPGERVRVRGELACGFVNENVTEIMKLRRGLEELKVCFELRNYIFANKRSHQNGCILKPRNSHSLLIRRPRIIDRAPSQAL